MDDYYDAKLKYKTITDIILEKQNEIDFVKIISDWDRIYYKYDNFMDRLRELNEQYKNGVYYVAGINYKISKKRRKVS